MSARHVTGKPVTVLLDGTFLSALTDPFSPDHDTARTLYVGLVHDYSHHRARLVACSEVLDAERLAPGRMPADDILAPVERLVVSASHRLAASRTAAPISAALALTLVIVHREQIDLVATFDPDVALFQVATAVPGLAVGQVVAQ